MDIIQVVSNNEQKLTEAYVGPGQIINSDFLDGLNVDEAKVKIIEIIERGKIGKKKNFFSIERLGYF